MKGLMLRKLVSYVDKNQGPLIQSRGGLANSPVSKHLVTILVCQLDQHSGVLWIGFPLILQSLRDSISNPACQGRQLVLIMAVILFVEKTLRNSRRHPWIWCNPRVLVTASVKLI